MNIKNRSEAEQVKIDVITGFLGAGKTTFINKVLESITEKDFTVILENEFGEISVDAMSFDSSLVDVKEINSGCICCTFQGDFQTALEGIYEYYNPDRIIIEPSGIAHMSQVIEVIEEFLSKKDKYGYINIRCVIIDVLNYEMYKENFSDFYTDQIENAASIILSKIQYAEETAVENVVQDVRDLNGHGIILSQNWAEMSTPDILKFVEPSHDQLINSGQQLQVEKNISDVQFEQWSGSIEEQTSLDKLNKFIDLLKKSSKDFDSNNGFGMVLRAKGIIKTDSNQVIKFDYIPGYFWQSNFDQDVDTGRINLIGVNLNKELINDFWYNYRAVKL